MRLLIVASVISSFAGLVMAESTSEFMSEGRVWYSKHYDTTTGQFRTGVAEICGDTILGNGQKAKIFKQDAVSNPLWNQHPSMRPSIYEIDGRIYQNFSNYNIPLYDFSYTVGDKVPVFVSSDFGSDYDNDAIPDSYYDIIDDRTIILYGYERRMLTLTWTYKERDTITFCWIDGIGVHSLSDEYNTYNMVMSEAGPVVEISYGNYECYQGEELLYSRDDFENQLAMNDYPLAEIKGITTDSETDLKNIYDLTGRKLTGQPTPGIYIVGGKKILLR